MKRPIAVPPRERPMSDEAYIETITRNKKARHDYTVLEEYEAGLALLGSEVKSLREHRVHLKDAYASFKDGELYLVNARIDPYPHATHNNHEPERARKLLLHKNQIERLRSKVREKGLTLIALELYFKDGRAKAKIGVCEGKKHHDKRHDLKKREHQREIERERARRDDYF